MAAGLGHRQEVYSIDKCFVDVNGIQGDLVTHARKIRAHIHQWIGIPTCIGIGPTKTLAKLANMDPVTVQRKWSIVLAKTVRELNGTSCLTLDDIPPDKQQIACTRSFGHLVIELNDLLEAITEFASRAAEKLRKQNSRGGQIMAFVRLGQHFFLLIQIFH